VAGTLKFHSTTDANPRSAGSGNVVNTNIKTINEGLALTPEDVLCALCQPQTTRTRNWRTKLLTVSSPYVHIFNLDQFTG